MEDTQHQIPEDFDFNEADVVRPRSAQYNDGFYKGALVKARRSVAKKSQSMQIETTLRALDSADVLKGPTIRLFVTIPLPNPSVPGHKPYEDGDQRDLQFKRAREFIRAVLGDEALPAFPKARDGQPGVYFDPATGENMTLEEKKAKVKEIDTKTISLLQGWWRALKPGAEKDCDLIGAGLYFATKRKGEYANVSYVRHDDGGKEVTHENFASVVDLAS